MPRDFEKVQVTPELRDSFGAIPPDALDPRVASLAKFIGTRLRNPQIESPGFMLSAMMAVHDLETGVSSVDGEPIEHDLVGLEPDAYITLAGSVPAIAAAVFPPKFANQVKELMIEGGLIGPTEPVGGEVLSEGEIITAAIETIDDAQTVIVNDAKRRILALDWDHFGISTEEVDEIFDRIHALLLQNAPFALSLGVLDILQEHEAAVLSNLPANRKAATETHSTLWIALVGGSIPAEEATFTRDYLFSSVPEVIADMKQIDELVLLGHFMADDDRSPLYRASTRMGRYMQDHPGIRG